MSPYPPVRGRLLPLLQKGYYVPQKVSSPSTQPEPSDGSNDPSDHSNEIVSSFRRISRLSKSFCQSAAYELVSRVQPRPVRPRISTVRAGSARPLASTAGVTPTVSHDNDSGWSLPDHLFIHSFRGDYVR